MPAKRFITFEGGEGSGKSTQARLLADRLRSPERDVVLTREPGGSPIAEKIRALILDEPPQEPAAELLLFAAARAEHLAATIAPALRAGHWVICDRFIDSTRVYQGGIWHMDPTLIHLLEKHTVEPFMPALTIILDLPVDIAMTRAAERGVLSRYDAQRRETHDLIRHGFADIASAEPKRCILIDASGDQQLIAAAVWSAVASRLDVEPR
ncbi:MAG: dTMP kinase [Hyphomicrobiaceae bacterium]